MKCRRESFLALLAMATLCMTIACGGNDGPTNSTPTTTTVAAATTVVTDFTLRARDCSFSWSRPLETLEVGDSFTIRFKPLEISEPRSGDWASTAEFWLDRLDFGAGETNAIGMTLVWRPNSQWAINFFSPETRFAGTGQNEVIHVGGRFREVTYLRAAGVSEWLLDGVSVLQIPDTKPRRTVYTRVVGTETLFQFEEVVSTLKASSALGESNDCMLTGDVRCARP